MAEETIVKLNGKEWIAREPVAWRLQPDIPLALMQGQNTHADTQGLLEYPVLFRGLMGRWEQRLGRDVDGYWDNQGVLVNDGAAARAIRLVTTSPANMATGADLRRRAEALPDVGSRTGRRHPGDLRRGQH